MKKIAGIVLLAVLAVVLAAGCGEPERGSQVTSPELRVVGHYDSEANAEDKLKILAHHTFEMTKAGAFTSGSWVLEGDRVLLSAGSFTDTLEIEGVDLVQKSDGTRWIKM